MCRFTVRYYEIDNGNVIINGEILELPEGLRIDISQTNTTINERVFKEYDMGVH